MGWNDVRLNQTADWLSPEVNGGYCYYVHSYYVEAGPDTVATTHYCGTDFAAMMRRDNFYAAQFHPEKSAAVGDRIIRDFLAV
jgi:glutamine amidotransferase